MRESSPIELAGSVTKSRIYFRHVRWKEGDGVQDVDIDCCTISKIGGLDANVADTNLES